MLQETTLVVSRLPVTARRARAHIKMASESEMNSNDTNETVADNKETEEILLPTSKNNAGITKDPNFAVVCSFIKIFGPLLHFKELSIETLQHFFDTPTQGIWRIISGGKFTWLA